jgi:hypothetical protein
MTEQANQRSAVMVERMHSGAELYPAEDDFEWVNAWADGSGRERNPAPARSAAAADAPVQSATAGGDVVAVAPQSPAPIDAVHVAGLEPATVIEASRPPPAAPPSNPLALPLAVIQPEPVAAIQTVDAEDARPPSIAEIEPLPQVDAEPPSLGRRPWTSLFRLIAGGAGQSSERPTDLDVVTETVSAEAPAPDTIDVDVPVRGAVEAGPAAPRTIDAGAPAQSPREIASVPPHDREHIPLAPDQLERDIAEIEIVRDRLLAQPAPVELAPQIVSTRSRSSELAPILVGAALGFILLVVFGAAASFVSLR